MTNGWWTKVVMWLKVSDIYFFVFKEILKQTAKKRSVFIPAVMQVLFKPSAIIFIQGKKTTCSVSIEYMES